jgi:pimeloyl-ACP methyl ester carboxylesterase
MSALVAEASRPRGVIVALHGGAAKREYFDAPNRPRLSLLRTGAALGFTVIALDRPGYGSSARYVRAMTSAARRVDLAYAAVGLLLEARPGGAGVFLLGHSMGCVLAIQMAADERGAGLLGLEISGTGREYQPQAAAALGARMRGGTERAGTGLSIPDMVWGPGHLYPPDAASGIYSPSPRYEGEEVRGWPGDFPGLAARVRIPVRYSLGDHERVWRSGPAALADIAALFTASPRVVAEEQAGTSHNVSVGLSAVAYHLKVLSFAEECVLARENAISGNGQDGAAAAPVELAGG